MYWPRPLYVATGVHQAAWFDESIAYGTFSITVAAAAVLCAVPAPAAGAGRRRAARAVAETAYVRSVGRRKTISFAGAGAGAGAGAETGEGAEAARTAAAPGRVPGRVPGVPPFRGRPAWPPYGAGDGAGPGGACGVHRARPTAPGLSA
ncbi:hypothetical protein GCM10010327_60600 [Streptomyces nitrosporeus]|nr:hypothetical protein GCM10010327_60600 [Streptomyces nitrosporeus]